MNEAIKRAIEIAGGQSALAIRCGVTQPAVHKWATGKSRPDAITAQKIEAATNGEVSRIDLRPDIYGQEYHGEAVA